LAQEECFKIFIYLTSSGKHRQTHTERSSKSQPRKKAS
jgi:hypothetical protein